MSPAATHDDAAAIGALERATDELFYQRGVVDVSVAEIRDRSGVSLRRLYSLCPSKADLISLWLRYRHTGWMTGFEARVEAELKADGDPVDAVFNALADWMTETDFRGCGFINTHAESSELTDDHRRIVRDHKAALARYLGSILTQGDAVAVVVDGAIVQAAIFRSTEPIDLARRAARALVASDHQASTNPV